MKYIRKCIVLKPEQDKLIRQLAHKNFINQSAIMRNLIDEWRRNTGYDGKEFED